jgi:hypothetical protein
MRRLSACFSKGRTFRWVRYALSKKMARCQSHYIERFLLVVIAISMLLDDNHFVMMAVSVPSTIMIPVPITSFDDNYAFLRLRWCSERHRQAESSQRRECKCNLAHIFLHNFDDESPRSLTMFGEDNCSEYIQRDSEVLLQITILQTTKRYDLRRPGGCKRLLLKKTA